MKNIDLGGQIAPTDRVLFRSKFPHNRANFGGSTRAKETIKTKDLGDTGIWRNFAKLTDVASSRCDPTLTRASPGLRSQNNSLKLIGKVVL